MPHVRFNTEVVSCRFDDERFVWRLGFSTGDQKEVDVVIASGVLHHPNIPALPGLSSFQGKVFHSARWEDSAELDGTRVGVIG
jgi:cation diffusion facilitator CzcD-associated flavoprotein CzcO